MKKLTFLFATLLMLATACGNKQQATETTPATITVDELLDRAPVLVDSLVSFEGTCSHTCRHGARKMFLVGSSPERIIRVEACELGSFDPEVIHRSVNVTGYLREQRIDEQYLASCETSLAEPTAIDDGEASCETENAAHGINATSAREKIDQYRQLIADRTAKEGTPYLSFYYVDAIDYSVNPEN